MAKFDFLVFKEELKNTNPLYDGKIDVNMLIKKYYDIIYVNQYLDDEGLKNIDFDEMEFLQKILKDYEPKISDKDNVFVGIMQAETLRDNLKYVNSTCVVNTDDYM